MKYKVNVFKVGDRILYKAHGTYGTVKELREHDDTMSVLFDGDKSETLCVNSDEWFSLVKQPSKEEKAEWANIWDEVAEDT